MTDRMPLYPLLLGAIRNACGDVPRMVALAQAVIDAGTCALIAALGAAISPRVGLIAGVLAALSATLVVFSTQILTDTVFLFFFALMLLAGARFLIRSPAGSRLPPGPRSPCSWRRRCRSSFSLRSGTSAAWVPRSSPRCCSHWER